MRLISHNYAQDPSTIITASSQNHNFPASNIAHEHRSKTWRSIGNENQWIKFDLKTTEEINTIVLLWPKGGYKLSNNANIKVQASATADFSVTGEDQFIYFNPSYEMASLYLDEPKSFRYWRILIDDPDNVYDYVHLGVVVLGMSESTDQPDNGFAWRQLDTSSTTTTDFGQNYVDIYPILNSLSLNFNVMEFDQARKFIDLYTQVGIRKTVFVVLDEKSLVFDKDIFSIYGRFSNSHDQTHISYNLFNSSLAINESN